jgi:hypothetical protein
VTVPEQPQDPVDPLAELRARADALELQLATAQAETESRLVRAELKAEAIRAGMVDLDGLKLLDLSHLKLSKSGELENASTVMSRFRQAKPWLFGSSSSSSPSTAPPAQPPRNKLATEMTDVEYRAARAALVKRRT